MIDMLLATTQSMRRNCRMLWSGPNRSTPGQKDLENAEEDEDQDVEIMDSTRTRTRARSARRSRRLQAANVSQKIR